MTDRGEGGGRGGGASKFLWEGRGGGRGSGGWSIPMSELQSWDRARRSDPDIPPPQGEARARLDRSRGGQRSAQGQQRDAFGQFAGGRESRRSGASSAREPDTQRGTNMNR